MRPCKLLLSAPGVSVWPRGLRSFLASFRRRLGPLYGVQVPRVLMIGALCLPRRLLCDVLRPFRTCCGYLCGRRCKAASVASVALIDAGGPRFLASLPTVCRFRTCRGRVCGLLGRLYSAVVLSTIQAVKMLLWSFCGARSASCVVWSMLAALGFRILCQLHQLKRPRVTVPEYRFFKAWRRSRS